MIAVVYAGASWAMAAHTGTGHVVAAATAQGPGLLFGLAGSTILSQAARWLFLTSLFAAALAFHNCTWRYMFALGRENVLPAALGRTGGNNIPKTASLVQSATGLAVIVAYAIGGWAPMENLFFWLGTAGGTGIMILLAATSVAVVAFFARDPRGENTWRRLIAPPWPPSCWPGSSSSPSSTMPSFWASRRAAPPPGHCRPAMAWSP